jgi:Short C-terminal domain/Phospholipase_D-nuclease N-terminal
VPDGDLGVRKEKAGEGMSLAAASTSYPLLNIFWTMFEFFLWVIWIWLIVMVVFDIFRSRDLSGWAKALWVLFVVVIPLIGVLVYLIARGGTMHDRATQRALGQDQEIRDFGQQYTGPSSADQLATLADLRDRGVITADEFDREKAKVLV